jgi:hypothetical protein
MLPVWLLCGIVLTAWDTVWLLCGIVLTAWQVHDKKWTWAAVSGLGTIVLAILCVYY